MRPGTWIVCAALASAVHASWADDDTTYFQTRQLSGQQYGLDYNLQNNNTPGVANVNKLSNRPRTLFDWNILSAPPEVRNTNGAVSRTEGKTVNVHETNPKGMDAERVENNVWWPWKNYDDWLNGRRTKAERPKERKEEKKADNKEKKNRKRKKKKNRKKNRPDENGRKRPKNEKKRPTVEGDDDDRRPQLPSLQPAINNGGDDSGDEIVKKGFIPKIRYNSSPIDIIMRNRSLVPTLVKYSSRNYTYDVNECLINNGGCEGLCINTPGSYRCHCPPGFVVADTKCEDVDECLLRNGHGPCQGACANTWGGYRCSCRGVPGTRLAGDGHACDDVDECADGTAGCSHQCINAVGSAFCACPDGMRLDDDWKTCVDEPGPGPGSQA